MEIILDSKQVETLLNGILENEFVHVNSRNLKDMKDIKKYKEINQRNVEISNILKEHLSDEDYQLFIEYDDNWCQMSSQYENRYWFKQGIKGGITNLGFLKKTNLIIEDLYSYYLDNEK